MGRVGWRAVLRLELHTTASQHLSGLQTGWAGLMRKDARVTTVNFVCRSRSMFPLNCRGLGLSLLWKHPIKRPETVSNYFSLSFFKSLFCWGALLQFSHGLSSRLQAVGAAGMLGTAQWCCPEEPSPAASQNWENRCRGQQGWQKSICTSSFAQPVFDTILLSLEKWNPRKWSCILTALSANFHSGVLGPFFLNCRCNGWWMFTCPVWAAQIQSHSGNSLSDSRSIGREAI